MELELIARLILSLMATGLGFGPMVADFNRTHATNPEWTPHARFHVVWQVLIQTGVSLIVLYLLWLAPGGPHLWVALALCANWVVTFFITVFAMPRFGGTLADVGSGIPPFRLGFGAGRIEVDTNLVAAGVAGFLVSTVAVLLWMAS